MRDDLHRILLAAVTAIDPCPLVRAALVSIPRSPRALFVVAAGKAAWSMASGLQDVRDRIVAGVVAGPRRAGVDIPPTLEPFDAGHPAPTTASELAGRRALAIAALSREDATLLVLLSGGASAMLAVPAPGVSLEAKGAAAAALMRAGVPIDGLNCVRKHVSAIKGGRLAEAARRTATLAISDVHGPPVEDDPAVIGSGPTVPDPTTFADACAIIEQSGAEVPPPVLAYLRRGAAGHLEETPKPGDVRLAERSFQVLANRHTAMAGAAAAARALGYAVDIVGPPTHGEAREASRAFVAYAARVAARARHAGQARRVCVIASGETIVHVRGAGRGGRNQEFALAAARPLHLLAAESGDPAVLGSAGTDGVDGPTPAAGAIVDSTTALRAQALGLSVDDVLARNASHDFFVPLGDAVTWGPTGTNVGDVHVFLTVSSGRFPASR